MSKRTTPLPGESLEMLAEQARAIAGDIIGQWFLRMHRRKVFARLRRAVLEAQRCLALDILKQLCPLEAQLLSDPTFKPIVRLRLGGARFPPSIFFKVFLKKDTTSIVYFSGKKYIRPATEAAQDACKLMGKKQFLEQVLDDIEQAKLGCFDELDVSTLKDYMKVMCDFSHLCDTHSSQAPLTILLQVSGAGTTRGEAYPSRPHKESSRILFPTRALARHPRRSAPPCPTSAPPSPYPPSRAYGRTEQRRQRAPSSRMAAHHDATTSRSAISVSTKCGKYTASARAQL
jgi:hypothetical protein